MLITPLLCALIGATTQIWVEDAAFALPPEPEFVAGRSGEGARLYAFPGEGESFQVIIQAPTKGIHQLQLAPPKNSPRRDKAALPDPKVYIVQFVNLSDALEDAPQVFDRLETFAPIDVPPKATLRLWATYDIPREQAPGMYDSALSFTRESGPRLTLPVRIEVFPVPMPEVSPLPVIAPVDEYGLRGVLGPDALPQAELCAFLQRYHLSPILWDDGELFAGGDPAPRMDAALPCLEHATIDAGGTGLVDQMLDRRGALVMEGLILVEEWLAKHSLLPQAQVQYWVPQNRDTWGGMRALLVRHYSEAPSVARMLVGAPRPEFAGVAERWALPYESIASGAGKALSTGEWIDWPVRRPLVATATGLARIGDGLTNAMDAFDGALMTAWSAQAKLDGDTFDLVAEFRDDVTTKTIQIIWDLGLAAPDVEVSTSFRSGPYANPTLDWAKPRPIGIGRTLSVANLKYDTHINAIRFRFSGLKAGNVVRVAEVLVDPAMRIGIPSPDVPCEPWLWIGDANYPAPALGKGQAARAIGGLCWGLSLRGVLMPQINRWPEGTIAGQPLPAMRTQDSASILCYPGINALLPSLRLERLRDGIEDYTVLTMLARAIDDDRLEAADAAPLLRIREWPAWPMLDELDELIAQLDAAKRDIGEVMSR